MKRLTIIREDNNVVVDGETRKVDLSGMDSKIHAVQWCHCPERKKTKGWIEWEQDPLEDFRPNTPIETLDQFKSVIDAFHAAPTEEQRHARVRADHLVELTEKEAKRLEVDPSSDPEIVERAKRAVVTRKKERDEVYQGTRTDMGDGLLVRDED